MSDAISPDRPEYAPAPFALARNLRRVLRVTERAWGLGPPLQPPRPLLQRGPRRRRTHRPARALPFAIAY